MSEETIGVITLTRTGMGEFTPEVEKELSDPIPSEHVKTHPTKTFLSVVKSYYTIERLNNVLGVGQWDLEHTVLETDDGKVLVRGRLYSIKYNVFTPYQYGGSEVSGKSTDLTDAYKGAVTDLQSKCASYWGVAREIFLGEADKPQKKRAVKPLEKPKAEPKSDANFDGMKKPESDPIPEPKPKAKAKTVAKKEEVLKKNVDDYAVEITSYVDADALMKDAKPILARVKEDELSEEDQKILKDLVNSTYTTLKKGA